MAQTLLEIAKDLTLTLVEAGRLSSEDMQDSLQRTHATLAALKAREETGATTVPVSVTPPSQVDWRKSITKHTVTCLECGKTFKQLSRRHLMTHGLDGRSYRAKYRIPRTQPLSARDTIARRRQVAQKARPWETAPMYRRAQERAGKAPPVPEAQAPRKETEVPAVAAHTPPKRARKTTPKKAAQKKSREG